jgi:hypothetical protein
MDLLSNMSWLNRISKKYKSVTQQCLIELPVLAPKKFR